MAMFVSKGQSAQPTQAKAHSERWRRLLTKGKGGRGDTGRGTENLVVVSGNIGVGALGQVRRILRAGEKGLCALF